MFTVLQPFPILIVHYNKSNNNIIYYKYTIGKIVYLYQQHDAFEQLTAHFNQDSYNILTQNCIFYVYLSKNVF